MVTLPISYLHECFECDGASGILTWKIRPLAHFSHLRQCNLFSTRYAGKIAGGRSPSGYLDVFVAGRKIRIHRVIWAMETGAWPVGDIDHRNRDKADNRFLNLREADHSQNGANKAVSPRNKVGLKGVCPHGKRFRAQIKTRDRVVLLGIFDTAELAHQAYAKAAREHHGEFAGGIS